MLEDRLKELTDYLKIKGLEVSEQDIYYFKTVLNFAINDGYHKGVKVAKESLK